MNHSNMHYYVIRNNFIRIFYCLNTHVYFFFQISKLIITALRRRIMHIFAKLLKDIESKIVFTLRFFINIHSV